MPGLFLSPLSLIPTAWRTQLETVLKIPGGVITDSCLTGFWKFQSWRLKSVYTLIVIQYFAYQSHKISVMKIKKCLYTNSNTVLRLPKPSVSISSRLWHSPVSLCRQEEEIAKALRLWKGGLPENSYMFLLSITLAFFLAVCEFGFCCNRQSEGPTKPRTVRGYFPWLGKLRTFQIE